MSPGAEVRARIAVYRGDTAKYALKLWVEDAERKKASSITGFNADEKLKKVFGGKSVVNMFEMTKLVSKHLS